MLWIAIGVAVALTALCALSYRLGGMSKIEAQVKLPWVPQFLVDGWVRDFFCSALPTLWLYFFLPQVAWWVYLLCMAVTWMALTTYWDDIFTYDNFFAHGFGIANGFIPYVIANLIEYKDASMLIGFFGRVAMLSLAMGILSKSTHDVDIEEYGRGGFIGATLPLLLVGC